jgi:trigger factor
LQSTHLDLPETVVQDETRQTIYEMVSEISRRGTSDADIEQQKEELFDAASRSAEDKVKVRYILARIAEAESIEVTQREIDEQVEAMAGRQGVPAEEIRAELQKKDQLDNLALDVRFQKTLDFLINEANLVSSSAV